MEKSIRLMFGRNLREIRRKRKLTQEKLSELAKIDYKYLQRIEGKNPPNIKLGTLARLARSLEVDPPKLLAP